MERFSLYIPLKLKGSFWSQRDSWNHGEGKWKLDWTSVKVYNFSSKQKEKKTKNLSERKCFWQNPETIHKIKTTIDRKEYKIRHDKQRRIAGHTNY